MLHCKDLSALRFLTVTPSGGRLNEATIRRRDHVTSVKNKSSFSLPGKWATGFLYFDSGAGSHPLVVASTVANGRALNRTTPRSFRGAKSSNNTSDTQTEEMEGTTMKSQKIKGTVVLMKKNVLDFNDFNASVLDRVHELVGKGVTLQLVSAVNGDPVDTFSLLLVHFVSSFFFVLIFNVIMVLWFW